MSRQLIEQTTGKWRGILIRAGIAESFLNGKKGPCPICKAGKDRFRFDDKNGSGSFICSYCGSGYGIHLLQKVLGLDYSAACRVIEREVANAPIEQSKPKALPAQILTKARALWDEAADLAPGSATFLYLRNRGILLETMPRLVHHHDRVMYLDEEGEFHGRLPAMLSLIQEADGKFAGLHRTYLTADGMKAAVPEPRKILGALGTGSAVRLAAGGPTLGIAEGIETALAAQQIFNVPVWAALTAGNLERWTPPQGTREVFVFGDNDLSFTGQAAAFALGKRLKLRGYEVSVHVPLKRGADWNDVLLVGGAI
jgi:putative DNA primase/helicase